MQTDRHGFEFTSQHGEQRGILRASTRDDHLAIATPLRSELRQNEAADSICNRSRRQCGGRRHHIGLAGAMTELKKMAYVFAAKFFAACRARRLLAKKARAQ